MVEGGEGVTDWRNISVRKNQKRHAIFIRVLIGSSSMSSYFGVLDAKFGLHTTTVFRLVQKGVAMHQGWTN